MKRNLNLFINDILENIKDIEIFSKSLSKTQFLSDRLKQNAIVRSLEIMGEAVKNIPNSFKNKHTEIEWKKIAGFRDILTHSYFRVDLDLVWKIIEKDLPDLKKKILKIKDELKKNN